MVQDDFCWKCPKCKTINWESEADDEKDYICNSCAEEFYMTFSVEVEEITSVEDEKQKWERKNPIVKISSDEGKTWRQERINTMEFDADKSNLKYRDIIELDNGDKYRILVKDKKLSTVKLLSGRTN